MLIIDDYLIIKTLKESENKAVFRARKENGTFIIKLIKKKKLSPLEVTFLLRKYETLKSLRSDGVFEIKDILDKRDFVAVVLEDFPGTSLKENLNGAAFNFPFFLETALKIASIVGTLHKNGVSHYKINPYNIFIHNQTGELKLGLPAAESNPGYYDTDEKTYRAFIRKLLYIAPEQTGRIEQSADFRSDLYSLGALFYEMLTGSPPFKENTPAALVHAHLARRPQAPNKSHPLIPKVISDIVLKLLAKMPGDRYQNCFGLVYDLTLCMKQWEERKGISVFPIASRDISLNFNITQQLVNRTEEKQLFLKLMERVKRGGREALFIEGAPGIGKSALLRVIQNSIPGKEFFFVSGKYEKTKQDIPYSAILGALDNLINMILTESPARVEKWRKRLLRILGVNSALLWELVPGLKLLLHTPPPVSEATPEEMKNRFHLVFFNFLKAFARSSHPFVLFLDDLSRADPASLDFIKNALLKQNIRFFLLIGTHRPLEKGMALQTLIQELKSRNASITQKSLSPLELPAVTDLIRKLLKCDQPRAFELAEVITRKTNGNPFFVNQFIKKLYDEGGIQFNSSMVPSWDIKKIESIRVSENVANLLTAKISTLAESVREVLKAAACVGNSFKPLVVSHITDRPLEETIDLLTPVMNSGYIQLYKNGYRFTHDRIRDAVYNLIGRRERSALHHAIGNYTLSVTPNEELPGKINYIVNHFNKGMFHITDYSEFCRVGELNLAAGLQVKKTAAYTAAASYFSKGILCFKEKSWELHYDILFKLHYNLMEALYIFGDFSSMEERFFPLLKRVKSAAHKGALYYLMVKLYTSRGMAEEAVKAGIEGLGDLNFRKLKNHYGKFGFIFHILKLRLLLHKTGIEEIGQYSFNPDGRVKMIFSILGALVDPMGMIQPQSIIVIASITLNYYIKNKELSVNSSFCFIGLALMAITLFKDYKRAFLLADLAFKINEKLDESNVRPKVLYLYANSILHWQEPLRKSIACYTKAFKAALVNGNYLYALYSLNQMSFSRFILGQNIEDVSREYFSLNVNLPVNIKELDFFEVSGLNIFLYYSYMKEGIKSSYTREDGEDVFPAAVQERVRSMNFSYALSFFLFARMKAFFLFARYKEAYDYCLEFKRYIRELQASIMVPEFYFYESLILVGMIPAAHGKNRQSLFKSFYKNLKIFKKWKNLYPGNFLSKYLILKAEAAKLKEDATRAARFFHEAIYTAKENRFPFHEALANKLIGEFYVALGIREAGAIYLNEASILFSRCGANRVVERIECLYGDVMALSEAKIKAPSRNQDRLSQLVDVSTVLNLSETLSKEIEKERLLKVFMKVAIVNAGAARGLLILKNPGDQRLYIEAEGTAGEDILTFSPVLAEHHRNKFSLSIFNYVKSAGEGLILDNASVNGIFKNDSYVIKNKAKSVLCTPIKYKGKVSGYLYMENNLAAHVFKPERLKLLNMLSSQAAISFENVYLIREREKKMTQAHIELVMALSQTIEAKDPYTRGHCLRVRNFAGALGIALGFSSREILLLEFGALLHDIGKIGIPGRILNKNASLTDEEQALIKKHPSIGAGIVSSIEYYKDVVPMIQYHHEYFNGMGYPDGLRGDEIPLGARVLAIADTYDAMTSDRPYRKALETGKALEILKKISGTQLDPNLVDLFISEEIYRKNLIAADEVQFDF